MKTSTKLAVLGLVLFAANGLTQVQAQFPFPSEEEAEPEVVAPVLDVEPPEPVVVEPVEVMMEEPAALTLTEAVPTSSQIIDRQQTARELRTARAQLRSKLRIERLERNLWSGYEPLRPNWNAIPMMSSRFPYRNTVGVPVYVYPW